MELSEEAHSTTTMMIYPNTQLLNRTYTATTSTTMVMGDHPFTLADQTQGLTNTSSSPTSKTLQTSTSRPTPTTYWFMWIRMEPLLRKNLLNLPPRTSSKGWPSWTRRPSRRSFLLPRGNWHSWRQRRRWRVRRWRRKRICMNRCWRLVDREKIGLYLDLVLCWIVPDVGCPNQENECIRTIYI